MTGEGAPYGTMTDPMDRYECRGGPYDGSWAGLSPHDGALVFDLPPDAAGGILGVHRVLPPHGYTFALDPKGVRCLHYTPEPEAWEAPTWTPTPNA
jgi:hypothetical protein